MKRPGIGSVWDFVRKCKRGTKKWKPWNFTNIQDSNGVLGSGPQQNATNFQVYYNDLFSNEATQMRPDNSQMWFDQMHQYESDMEWGAPSEAELLRAAREIKNTAPGLSGVPAMVWQSITDDSRLRMIMLQVMKDCWEKEEVPKDWRIFYMTVLEKDGDHSLPKNYRGIAIAEAISKIYTTILKYRLTDFYEGVVPEYANGFRKGRGRSDSISAVLDTLRKRKGWGQRSYLLLCDVVKCFDVIKRDHIWSSMKKMGVNDKMIRVVKSTLKDTTAILHVEGEQRRVDVKEGTGQGTTLGPVLCNLLFLPLLLHWEELWCDKATLLISKNASGDSMFTGSSLLHNFADDMAIIVKTRQEAEEISTDLYAYLQDFMIDLHVATPTIAQSKSVVLFVPANNGDTEIQQCEPLNVDIAAGKTICFVNTARYLGHIISSDLSDNTHISARMAKASQVFGALKPHLFNKKEVWKCVKAKVMETMVLPTLLDGIECCTVTKKSMNDMESMYLRFVRSALRITPYTQRKLRLSSEALLRKLGVKPLHYYLDLKVLGYAGHVERMSPNRLTKIIRNSSLCGARQVGRPFKTVDNNIVECLRRKKIGVSKWKEIAQDKQKWAKIIRRHVNWNAKVYQPRKWSLPFWATNPCSILGYYVEKKFGRTWHMGEIVNYDFDVDTNEIIWGVLFHDGDSADFNVPQLQRIICLDMPTMPRHAL